MPFVSLYTGNIAVLFDAQFVVKKMQVMFVKDHVLAHLGLQLEANQMIKMGIHPHRVLRYRWSTAHALNEERATRIGREENLALALADAGYEMHKREDKPDEESFEYSDSEESEASEVKVMKRGKGIHEASSMMLPKLMLPEVEVVNKIVDRSVSFRPGPGPKYLGRRRSNAFDG